jgi:hypothetical protein
LSDNLTMVTTSIVDLCDTHFSYSDVALLDFSALSDLREVTRQMTPGEWVSLDIFQEAQ